MKDKNRIKYKYVLAISAFVFSVGVIIMLFFSAAQKNIEQNSKEILMTNVERQSKHLKDIFDIQYQYLESIAAQMAEKKDLLDPENMRMLSSISEHTDLEVTALIETDGNSHYDNGSVKNVFHRRYFQEALSGKRSLSDPLESSVDHTTRIVQAVPVIQNDTVIGVLGGSCNVTNLSHLLFDDLFNGNGYSLIMDSEGTIITCDESDVFLQGDSFFDHFSSSIQQETNSLLQDLSEQDEGFLNLDTSNDKTTDHYLAYTPLGINGWMVGYVVPVEVAQEDYAFIRHYESILDSVFLLLVLLLILFILHISRKEQLRLQKSAQTDALTGLFNKEHTQKAIDAFLSSSDSLSCFMIIDSDNFKHINDTYGHYAGDMVLKALGKIYADNFRKQDILGRIGGDEFIIFMTDIPDREVAERKMYLLLEAVQRITLEEIENERLSISIGACFAPEHGSTYTDLYQHADTALYQTKKTTKNGYTLFKK